MRNNNIVLFIFLCSFLAIKADEVLLGIEEDILNIAESFDDNAAVRFVVTEDLNLSNSTDALNGNFLKEGVRFIHNFGIESTFVGIRAGNFTTSKGSSNTGLGVNALRSRNATANSNAQNNVAVGKDALTSNVNGSGNTAIGYMALFSNVMGNENTAAGRGALLLNTSGSGNVALGRDALMSNTVGNDSTAVGYATLASNTLGTNNTAVGVIALQKNTIGKNNTAVGRGALNANTVGSNNTAIGRSAMQSNQQGNDNVAVGSSTLLGGGRENTAIGALAGQAVSNSLNDQPNKNLFIGFRAGSNMQTGVNNLYIGHIGFTGDVGVIRIGDRHHKKLFIPSITKKAFVSSDNVSAVSVSSKGELGILGSSRRFKHNIIVMNDNDSALIYQLRPVAFIYKNNEKEEQEWGLIAEEVDEILPELVVKDEENKPFSIRYDVLSVLVLKEIQKQQLNMIDQNVRVEGHSKKINALKQMIENLKI